MKKYFEKKKKEGPGAFPLQALELENKTCEAQGLAQILVVTHEKLCYFSVTYECTRLHTDYHVSLDTINIPQCSHILTSILKVCLINAKQIYLSMELSWHVSHINILN